MADPGHQRQLQRRDRARERLVIEGKQVLERAAAAYQEQEIDFPAAVGEREHRRDFARGAGALHGHRVDEHPNAAAAASQHVEHVAKRGAGRRGHDADAARKAGQGALARGVEQAFGREFLLERLEAPPELAFPRLLEMVHDQLELAARLVEPDAGSQKDLQAVPRRETHREIALAEHGAAHLGILVLEREVPVAGGGPRKIGQLARDPQGRQARFEQGPRLAVQPADRINVAA